MKVIIGHYHLNPGGVTQIIQSQLNSLSNKGLDLFVVSSGQGQENIKLPECAQFQPLSHLGYLPHYQSTEFLKAEVEHILRFFEALTDTNDIIHFHNIGLGKNVALTYVMYVLACKGYKIINHAHDFSEDRPVNLSYLQKGIQDLGAVFSEVMYPNLDNYHFGVLNGFDQQRLLNLGVSEDKVHLWANPVRIPAPIKLSKAEARQMVCEGLSLDTDKLLVTYPVRVIRRKNIGEYILFAKVFEKYANFIVTLPPQNPVEIEFYQKWRSFCKEQRISVVFEAGLKLDFPVVMTGSDVCFTTSIMEGFGMVFVEPWLWSTPVAGRSIPEVIPDLKQMGLRYPLLYSENRVKHHSEWIDFSTLAMEEQMEYIACLDSKQIEEYTQQNTAISSFFKRKSMQFDNNNKEIITNDLSERKYGDKLYSTYKALS